MIGVPILNNRRKFLLHKAIKQTNFTHPTVLVDTPWSFVELWLKRHKKPGLSYWIQARRFYEIAMTSSTEVAPLASYYMMLNAIKCLLLVKHISTREQHGVSGRRDVSAKARLGNEKAIFHQRGTFPAFCRFLGESRINSEYSLKEILYNIPFIRRAYNLTYSDPELFIPIENPVYVRHPQRSQHEAWFEAQISLTVLDRRYPTGVPRSLDIFEQDKKLYVRRKKGFIWINYNTSIDRINRYHSRIRRVVVPISGPRTLWYLKKIYRRNTLLHRYYLPLLFAAMHRLSELSRYDPDGLVQYLSGQPSWLLKEFVTIAPHQFIDQLASEITGINFLPPQIRGVMH